MEKTLAMILAGGKGKRMDILCQVRPKPILPFGGRFRVIDFTLSNCVHSEVEEIAVITNHQRTRMLEYLKKWSKNNGGFNKLSILEPHSTLYKGTADAIYQNLPYLKDSRAHDVLVLAADHIYTMDYRQMLDFHRKVQADVTLGVIEVPIEEASRFGIIKADHENRVIDYIEKPEIPQNNIASMGIYIFNKEILIKRLEEYGSSKNSLHDLTYTIIPEMLKKDRFFVYDFNGYWRDIGSIEAFYKANMEIINLQEDLVLDKKWPILTGEQIPLQPVSLQDEKIVNSIISPGCVIKGRVENSVLSPGVRIDEEAEVRNSVLMTEVTVGNHSIIEHGILDKQVSIGRFSYIGYGSSLLEDPAITILGKGAIIPSGTAIGRNCKILPDIRPEDFTMSVVPSGSIVKRDSGSKENQVYELV